MPNLARKLPDLAPEPIRADPLDDTCVRLTHRVALLERSAVLARRPGPRTGKPECLAIGHHWRADPDHEGGLLCVVCCAVRIP